MDVSPATRSKKSYYIDKGYFLGCILNLHLPLHQVQKTRRFIKCLVLITGSNSTLKYSNMIYPSYLFLNSLTMIQVGYKTIFQAIMHVGSVYLNMNAALPRRLSSQNWPYWKRQSTITIHAASFDVVSAIFIMLFSNLLNWNSS